MSITLIKGMLYTLIYTNPKSVSTFWGNCTQRETHRYSKPRNRPDIIPRKSTKNFVASNLMQLSFLSIRKILTTIRNRKFLSLMRNHLKSRFLTNFLESAIKYLKIVNRLVWQSPKIRIIRSIGYQGPSASVNLQSRYARNCPLLYSIVLYCFRFSFLVYFGQFL